MHVAMRLQVRKAYRVSKRASKRMWKLKTLGMEMDDTFAATQTAFEQEKRNQDFESFMQDIEEDQFTRSQVKLYKDAKKADGPPPEEAVRTPTALPPHPSHAAAPRATALPC